MKALKWLEENFEKLILVVFLSALTILVMMQIFMRYVFGNPLTWSEELCRMILVWSGFFSIGYCARKGSTIRLDTVVVMLPGMVQRILMCLTTLFMVGLLGYLAMGAYELVMDTIAIGSMMAGLLIPQYWLYVGPLVGLVIGMLRFLQCLFRTKFYADLSKKKEVA